MSAVETGSRPLTVLVAALGGQGGGVLTDWISHAARALGRLVQATSTPGVSQRTGATTYYLEIAPTPAPDAPPPACDFCGRRVFQRGYGVQYIVVRRIGSCRKSPKSNQK